jgi:hypothetical protein
MLSLFGWSTDVAITTGRSLQGRSSYLQIPTAQAAATCIVLLKLSSVAGVTSWAVGEQTSVSLLGDLSCRDRKVPSIAKGSLHGGRGRC